MIVNRELDTRKLVKEDEYYRNLGELFDMYMIGQRRSKSLKMVHYKSMTEGKKEKVKD